MSDILHVLHEREADIGQFRVGRLLPLRQKRSVGPFVFFDHMGPAELLPGESLEVAPHPHIGLSTLTYLLEGCITHRDSLGNCLDITPGAVNWMTAGKGIVHSERSPEKLRAESKNIHGLQIWVGLPEHAENIDPSFIHIEAGQLPGWEIQGLKHCLIAGECMNRKSPVPVYCPLYFLEIIHTGNKPAEVSTLDFYGETGIFILKGALILADEPYTGKRMLILKNAQRPVIRLMPGTHVFIFGGEAFDKPRYISWNFVHSEKDKIEQARADWAGRRFPPVPGDDAYVPLPG